MLHGNICSPGETMGQAQNSVVNGLSKKTLLVVESELLGTKLETEKNNLHSLPVCKDKIIIIFI